MPLHSNAVAQNRTTRNGLIDHRNNAKKFGVIPSSTSPYSGGRFWATAFECRGMREMRDVYPFDGDAEDFWRIGARNGGSGVVARCAEEA